MASSPRDDDGDEDESSPAGAGEPASVATVAAAPATAQGAADEEHVQVDFVPTTFEPEQAQGSGAKGRSVEQALFARRALLVSYFSLVLNSLAVIIGLIVAAATGSAGTLAYSFENAIDLAGSALLVWRFGAGESMPLEVLETREKRASVGIALAMCALGVFTLVFASVHFTGSHESSSADDAALLWLSIPSIVLFGVIGVLKLKCADWVHSPAMRKDGVCSLAGAALSFAVCLGVVAWWIDPLVAMLVSLALLAFGLRTLVKNKREGNRWWTAEWWGLPGRRKARAAEEGPPKVEREASPLTGVTCASP